MTRVVFSAAARVDRREITAWTVQRFGIEQARRLRDRLESALHDLGSAPDVGRPDEELDPPDRSFHYLVFLKSFIVVYEPTDDGIRVVRLLHGARSLADELDRDSGDDD